MNTNKIIPKKYKKSIVVEGCGVLFKSGSGIIICGEKRAEGNQFLCRWCLLGLQGFLEHLKNYSKK